MFNTEHIVENRNTPGKRRYDDLSPLPSKEQLEYEEETLPMQDLKRPKYHNKNQPTYSEEVYIKNIVNPQRERPHTPENTSNIATTCNISIPPNSPCTLLPFTPLDKCCLPSRLPYSRPLHIPFANLNINIPNRPTMVDKEEEIYIPNMPPFLDNGVEFGVQLGIMSDIQYIYTDMNKKIREAVNERVSLGDRDSEVSTESISMEDEERSVKEYYQHNNTIFLDLEH